MKTIRSLCLIMVVLISAAASGCVYYPTRPYYHAEYYSDGYTPYYTNYYAQPYVGAVWVGGYHYRGHWVRPHWR